MKKTIPQMAFDFMSEPEPEQASAAGNPPESGQARAGVGVRLKSLKKAKVDPPADTKEEAGMTLFDQVEATQQAEEMQQVEETRMVAEEGMSGSSNGHAATEVKEEAAIESKGEAADSTKVDTPNDVAEEMPVMQMQVHATEEYSHPGNMAVAPPFITPPVTTPPVATQPVVAPPTRPTTKSKRGRKSLKQVSAEADLIEIPDDEVLFSKQYYTMGEVAKMFRVNQSLLRFWETEFDVLQPRKNKKGDRYFRPVDIKNLHLIYHLLRQRKYTIEGAKDFLKKNKKAEERFVAIQRLQEIRAFLLEWKAQL